MNTEAPWRIGFRAARANLVPGLILQSFMFFLLFGYYFIPEITGKMDILAALKTKWGLVYSMISAVIAGAIIPEMMRMIVFQKGRWFRKNTVNLLFAAGTWAFLGIIVDIFYQSQALLFGHEVNFRTVVFKLLMDQLVYTPFIATPLTCWLYDWKLAGFRFQEASRWFTIRYAREVMLPMNIANWGVWVPVVIALYSLPSALQVPLFGLALSLWVLLLTWISETRNQA